MSDEGFSTSTVPVEDEDEPMFVDEPVPSLEEQVAADRLASAEAE